MTETHSQQTNRIGQPLFLDEDFFSFTFVSYMKRNHLLVCMFQAKRAADLAQIQLECDRAQEHHEIAQLEQEKAQASENSEMVLAVTKLRVEATKERLDAKEKSREEAT